MPFFRRRRFALSEGWEDEVPRWLPCWRQLDDDERQRLLEVTAELVASRRWEAARGFELTEEAVLAIAANAALLVLALSLDAYDDVGTVIVHPSTMEIDTIEDGEIPGTEVSGRVDLLGEAWPGGPVLIAWDAARHEVRHPRRGRNVVFHEFSHKIDMAERLVDGTPLLSDPVARQRWIDVCTEVYDALCDGEDGGVLDEYGATDPAEFFAVATEAFFTIPAQLRQHEPDLYAVFASFYGQDPAARADRAVTP